MTRARAPRGVLVLALIALFGVSGFGTARGPATTVDPNPASAFAGRQDAAIASSEFAPVESAPNRPHQQAALAFLILAGAPALVVRRYTEVRRHLSRRRVEQFSVRLRGPPIALVTH
jgi:hypothetical protein